MILREIITSLKFDARTEGIQKFDAAVGKGMRSIMAVAAAASTALAAVGVAATFKIAQVAGEYQTLRTSLQTLTGSAAGAEQAFLFIKNVARTLPNSVQDLTTAFIALKGQGIEPTAQRLTAFANIAASKAGKGIQDVIEAVLDATVGETERLKEFGIKASKQGEFIDFTFRGVTSRVGNNVAAINEFLTSIGNVQLAGAATEQMNTLAGALSNAQDTLSNFFDEIGKAGFIDALTTEIKSFSIESETLAKTISDLLVNALQSLTSQLGRITEQDVEEFFTRVIESVELLIRVLPGLIDFLLATTNAFGWMIDNSGIIAAGLLVIAAGLTAIGVSAAAATGGMTILTQAAARIAVAAGVFGAVALASGNPEEDVERLQKAQEKLQQKQRESAARPPPSVTFGAKSLRAREGQELQSDRNRAAELARKKEVEDEKERKKLREAAAKERKKDDAALAEELRTQADQLVERDTKHLFQSLLDQGLQLAEASRQANAFRLSAMGELLKTPQTIQRRFAQMKEDEKGDKGADLLGTLTGGRLTSKRLGTAAKPGFGAQVLRININYHPNFDTRVNLKGSVQPISGEQLAGMMRQQVGEIIDKKNQAAFREIIQGASES